MKYILKSFLFHTSALWLTAQGIPGFTIQGGLQGMLFTAGMLSLLMLIVKPILKILFIPINFMTFGLLSWAVNIIVVYLLTFLVSGVVIEPWIFQGISISGVIIPSFPVSYIASLTCITITLTVITNVFYSISD